MGYKDVLVALTTYPDPTPIFAVDDAADFAAAIGATIGAIACEIKFQVPGSILEKAFINIPAMAAAESKKSAANAEKLLVAFQHSAERREIFQDRILERCLLSEVGDVLVEYARLRDLTIVPALETGATDLGYAQSVIFDSGRPTLVMPTKRRRAFELNTVIVAWDFSRPAARAVADALPILKKAKHVFAVTVSNEKVIDNRRSNVELAKHLARHNIDVVLDTVDAAGRGIGTALESYIASRNGDLLVMGAYGHSRLRDFILGGATRSMLLQPPVPVFLSH